MANLDALFLLPTAQCWLRFKMHIRYPIRVLVGRASLLLYPLLNISAQFPAKHTYGYNYIAYGLVTLSGYNVKVVY
jgi:hypothetical protein